MKNLLWGYAAALVMSFAACQDATDQQFVDQMKAQAAAAETAVAETETIGQSLKILTDQLELAPEALKIDTASGFETQYRNITGFQQKYLAASEQQADLVDRLNTLTEDYAAGRIKVAEAKKEYAVLRPGLENILNRTAEYRQVYDQLSADYARMMADFKARAEGD